MSHISEREVSISSMVTMDMDMIIVVGAMACSLVVGLTIAVAAYCCLVKKKRSKVRTNAVNVSSPKDISNSYIHYGSPGDSVRPVRKSKKNLSQRKPSEYSVYSQNSNDASIASIMEKFKNSFREESLPYTELDKEADDNKVTLGEKMISSRGKKLNISVALNTCQNLSSELSELGLTGSSVLSPTALQITASTSLCEQCLSPPPSPLALLGTSVSLPPTTLEMTKTALGMTNPTSNHPVVCDTCLSPSNLGETTRSLNLPYIGIGSDLRHRKMSPSGIVTNPRMKNPMLTTLREAMSNDLLETLVNIEIDDKLDISERREFEENSFDSLLSPSKACDWLSADPFDLSSDGDNSPDDPRMVKIQPQIKIKSTRQSVGSRGESLDSLKDLKSESKSMSKPSSCSDDPSKCLLSPPARNQSALPVLTYFSPMPSNASKGFCTPSLLTEDFHYPSRMTPTQFNKHTPMTPPQFQKGTPMTPQQFQKGIPMTPPQYQHQSSMTPPLYSPYVINQFFPIVPPPSPFHSPLQSKDSLSSIVSIKNSKSSRTSITITPNKPPLLFQFPISTNSPTPASHEYVESPNVAAIIRKQSSSSVTSTPNLNPHTPIKDFEFSPDVSEHGSFSHESPQTDNLSHHLAWDSTFEALKTLECSMKLVVTPMHKKIDETYDDSPQESNDSQLSGGPGDKSCVSSMSLAWDNTGELLGGADHTSPQSLNSSMQSMDIDEIIGRVAPNLTQCDRDIDQLLTPMPKINTIMMTPNSAHLSVFETSSPLLKKSVGSIDMDRLLDMDDDDPDTNDSTPNLQIHSASEQTGWRRRNETLQSVQDVSQLFPFNSPCPGNPPPNVLLCPPSVNNLLSSSKILSSDLDIPPEQGCHLQLPSLPLPISGSSLLSTVNSLPSSPNSGMTEGDFLSACGSMDSYSTAFEL